MLIDRPITRPHVRVIDTVNMNDDAESKSRVGFQGKEVIVDRCMHGPLLLV
jgi:hypothetical protein